MIKLSNILTLRERVLAWDDAGAVWRNSGWLVGDNLGRMVLALGVSAALARGLGAEDLGALKATLAFVTLCSSFTNLGLYGIVVKALAQKPEEAPTTLGTTALLYVFGSLVSFFACIGLGVALIDESSKLLLTLIFALGVLFHAPRIANLWFQYKVQNRHTVFAKGIPSVASGIGILVAAFAGAPVEVFAMIIVADTILGGLALTVLCAKAKDIPKGLRFTGAKARDLLSQSWPLIAASVAVKVYLKLDQVMLERMVDDTAVGVYGVAADISEIWYIVPTALATSALSGIVKLYTRDVGAYRERMQDLLDVLVLFAFGIVVAVLLTSAPLISFVYGDEFLGSIDILRVHILAAPFVFMGSINSKAIITEGYYKFSFIRHTCGAVVNVLLNLWLIPRYGGLGAAWATVFSYAMAHYLSTAFYRPAHPMFRQMSRALVLPFR